MKTLKSITHKKSSKQEREFKILLGLVEHYIKTAKPVGSNTLKESGFENLSSATIRNYFAKLEEEGYLSQQHSSGGRIPTHKAYRFYASDRLDKPRVKVNSQEFEDLRSSDSREIISYLQKSVETLSRLSHTAVFLSSPRFDQDCIIGIKLVAIDHYRCLCIIVTDFGMIKTEVINLEKKLSSFSVKRLESYFHWRLTGNDKPENLSKEEEQLGIKVYNELMVRYIVGYSNYNEEDVYRAGFSKLLNHTDNHNIESLANSLALFENAHSIRLLLKECCKYNQLKVWIGDDLSSYSSATFETSVIAIPYYINLQCVGAVGILGPVRAPYDYLFGLLTEFSNSISEALTRNIYKYKISFRQPSPEMISEPIENYHLLEYAPKGLLENKKSIS